MDCNPRADLMGIGNLALDIPNPALRTEPPVPARPRPDSRFAWNGSIGGLQLHRSPGQLGSQRLRQSHHTPSKPLPSILEFYEPYGASPVHKLKLEMTREAYAGKESPVGQEDIPQGMARP